MIKLNLLSNKNLLNLYLFDKFVGKCGTPTKHFDFYGNRLFVGDVVTVEDDIFDLFESVIIEVDNVITVMGLGFLYFTPRNQKIYIIKKKNWYYNVKENTTIRNIKYEKI